MSEPAPGNEPQDLTPRLDEVRRAYAMPQADLDREAGRAVDMSAYAAEFDRWLARHDAEQGATAAATTTTTTRSVQ